MDRTPLKDRTVLVVGGTSGIGAAVAGRFAEQGATVTVAGLDADRSRPHPEVTAVELDLRDAGALEALIGGRSGLDVLINCAGVIRRDAEYEPDVFRKVLDINLTGTMRACVAARDLLAASPTGGCIVNVASMLSFFGSPVAPAYSASKGGIVQLTRSLALGFADAGIRVNAVAPGWIHTDLTSALREDPRAEGRILSRTPMGRWGRPEDVAGPVLFLASAEAAFITGAVLPVDGGYHVA